jgi:phosphatidylglycerophosphatase A
MSQPAVPVSFLFVRPAHFLALGLGAGLSPVAPGTFGTLVAWPIAWGLHATGSDAAYLAVTAVLFALGIGAADVTARDLGVADHGAIVIDEVVAFLCVLFFVDRAPLWQLAAFVVFRVFDIVKPPPIRTVDLHMKGGFGVMFDDLLAAGYTLLVLALAQRVLA